MKFTTDGASLPKLLRLFIVWWYGQEPMDLIDRAGVFHDWLTWKYPNTLKHNRRRFIKLLTRFKVDKTLVKVINLGLWIYDSSPNGLKKLLKSLT